MLPFPLDEIPFIGDFIDYYNQAINFLSHWCGKTIIQLETLKEIEITGSGDTTFDYVKIVTTFLIALFFSVVFFAFTIKNGKIKNFEKVVFTYARYYLALNLLSYGFVKFYDGQFMFPSIDRLEQKIGDASPMGLLWTFMGYSKLYTVFSGICEVTGGILLFFRRTTVLGGLISFIVMVNIAVLNFSYDVPVKLFSIHLALISILVISPNIINLFQLFFLNKTTTLNVDQLQFQNKKLKNGRVVLKTLIILIFPTLGIIENLSFNRNTQTHNLSGAYFTEEFIKNNDTISPIESDPTRWNKLLITDYYAKLIFDNNKRVYYEPKIDTILKTITLSSYSDTSISYSFQYDAINEKKIMLFGKFKSDSISATFKIKRPNEYELVKRNFHWINEYPFNR